MLAADGLPPYSTCNTSILHFNTSILLFNTSMVHFNTLEHQHTPLKHYNSILQNTPLQYQHATDRTSDRVSKTKFPEIYIDLLPHYLSTADTTSKQHGDLLHNKTPPQTPSASLHPSPTKRVASHWTPRRASKTKKATWTYLHSPQLRPAPVAVDVQGDDARRRLCTSADIESRVNSQQTGGDVRTSVPTVVISIAVIPLDHDPC